MKQKKIVILFFILLCLISACYIISLQKSNTEKISPITQAEKYIEGYIYLDTNNRLCYNDTISNAVTIIEENVLDFKLANSNVVYLFRNSNGKHLAMYSFLTNESIILINNYIADFITYKDSLFYYENNNICEMNLQSGETNALMEIQTDDFIFNAVDDNRLILSFIKNSIPTTQEYIFKTGSSKDLAFDSSNIMINNNLIYGLDSSSNIFRIDSNGNLETISNFPVLKFYINDDYLIYIDFQGKLMSLSINGTNRVISDSVGDFVVFEDSLYYISPASKNNIFKTQLNGRHKEIVIANSNTNLKFSEIKKLLK